MHLIRFLILPALALGLAPALAVPQNGPAGLSEYNLDVWTERDGLPQNYVGAIAQTPDGYLWLGTEEGLARFDGIHFTVYGPRNTPAFSTGWITALWVDGDGTLWIGTGGGGLVRLRDGVFTAFTVEDGLSHNYIKALFRDSRGVLWIGTNGGGATRLVDGRFEVLGTRHGLSNDFVLSIAEDSHGSVWLGTAAGVNRFDGEAVHVLGLPAGLPSERIYDLLHSRDGSLWIASADWGIARLRNGEIDTYSTENGLTSDFATSLYEDRDGALWVGTNGGGLNRLHNGQFTSLTAPEGLPSDLVWDILEDREGNMWIGLNGMAGLSRLRDGVFSTVGRPEGLSSDIALAVLEDRYADLWIGTAGAGLNRLRGRSVSTFTTADGLAHDVILALAEGRNGDIWVGMAAGGISRIRDGKVRTFDRTDGLASTQVTAILENADGSLWLGTAGAGLQRWGSGASLSYTREHGLPDDYVTALEPRSGGGLWVGTRGGLAWLEDGRLTALPLGRSGDPINAISGLHEDGEGSLWVGTHEGIARVRDGRVSTYGEDVGMMEHEVQEILEDGHGHLWFSSNHGIMRVRKDELDALDAGRLPRVHATRFGRGDGMRTSEANGGVQPAGVRRADGTIWFPTMAGVAWVDPAQAEVERPLPPPILQQLVTSEGNYLPGDSVHLSADSRNLEFHFTVPTFVAPEEVGFRYMLEGFDDTWVEAQGRREAYYTNVPAGRYRFRVAARRGEGPWLAEEAALGIQIAPRLHETLAFRLLVVLGLVAMGGTLSHLRTLRLRDRQIELMALVAERERTERELRRSEEHLRLALEAGRMGTWEWNRADGTIKASPRAEALLGIHGSPAGSRWEEVHSTVAPESAGALQDLERRLESGDDAFSIDLSMRNLDGGYRYLELRGRGYSGVEGEPGRVVGVVADITDFMTSQEALRAREEELRQAQKMEAVGRLAGGVAHDFNNLLTAMSGRAQFLIDALPEGGSLRTDAIEVQEAAQRAKSLTQQLLAFSRKQVLQPTVLDLNALVGEMEGMLRRLIREDVVLETRLDPDVAHVRADPGGVEQILLNLVLNARDAMPDGGRIVVETRNAEADELGRCDGMEGEHAMLSVSDTGHGMDAETRKRAFDPFFTTKEVGKGTGLGLATVYGVVQQSGGQILLDSEPGRGARFSVFLPAVNAPAEVVATRPLEHSRPVRGGSETVLLVEDEPAVRSLARKALERHGYTVLEASAGLEALSVCERMQDPIHLLVSDVVMPGMGGRELAERIRQLRPGIRIILMSGYTEDEVLKKGGADSRIVFLEKPFHPDLLARTVRESLDGDRASEHSD